MELVTKKKTLALTATHLVGCIMGTQTSRHNTQKKHSISKLLKIKWKKSRLSRSQSRSSDHFIIERYRSGKFLPTDTANRSCSELEVRRVVFVSLIGLCDSWTQVPYHTLYSALCILPLKRKWICHPRQYVDELNARLLTKFCLNSDDTKEFIRFLLWKDEQGLVFWMLDASEGDSTTLVSVLWHNLSAKLCSLYDPVTGANYQPLQLKPLWWQNKLNDEPFVSKYNTKAASVLTELYFATLKFNTVQEIIYQSNPDSLIPIKNYHDFDMSNVTLTPSSEDSAWFISDDYDPYVMEDGI
eukprot:489068_1